MDQLMEKLIKAKAIMNKSDNIKRGDVKDVNYNTVHEFESPNVKYNIPDDILQENQMSVNQPIPNTKPVGVPTVDAIKNSKLPDEIKRLMIEHPIGQPQSQQATLSDDLIERASRLMNVNSNVSESKQTSNKQPTNTSGIDYKVLQKMIEEAVNKSLKENGLLVESSEKSNENFSFRVGKHVFEGRVTKIKKIQ